MTERADLLAHARLVALTEGVSGHRGTMRVIRQLVEEIESMETDRTSDGSGS